MSRGNRTKGYSSCAVTGHAATPSVEWQVHASIGTEGPVYKSIPVYQGLRESWGERSCGFSRLPHSKRYPESDGKEHEAKGKKAEGEESL